jgi:glycolate oxidase
VITGEHGIGLAKKRWWPDATSEVIRDLHRKLKQILDRGGILNPGKFIDSKNSRSRRLSKFGVD